MVNKIFPDLEEVKMHQNIKLPIVNEIKNDDLPKTYLLKHEYEDLGVMCIEFVFKINYAGILYEPKLVPHFCNKYLCAGSLKFNEYEISQLLQNLGAHIHLETNRMYSIVSAYFMTSQIESVLNIISDFLLNPTYPNNLIGDKILNEKKIYNINMERLSYISAKHISQILYGDLHPYGRVIKQNDFENIRTKDLLKFHDSFYSSNNLEIIISGDIPRDILKYLNLSIYRIKQASNKILEKNSHVFNLNKNILTPPFSNPKHLYISKDDALQTSFRIAKILPGPKHCDFFSLRVLIVILGGYFGSRLMKKIREEKGYTYGIGAYLVIEENYSELHISTEVGEKYTKLVFDEILIEISRLQNERVNQAELRKVKAYLIGSLLHSSDGIFNQAIMFRNLKKHNSSFNYIDKYVSEINNIGSDKIIEMAKKYLNKDSLSFVACGPPKSKLW